MPSESRTKKTKGKIDWHRVRLSSELYGEAKTRAEKKGIKPVSAYIRGAIRRHFWLEDSIFEKYAPPLLPSDLPKRWLGSEAKKRIEDYTKEIDSGMHKKSREVDHEIRALERYVNSKAYGTEDWHLHEGLYGFLLRTFRFEYSEKSKENLLSILGSMLVASRFDKKLREERCRDVLGLVKDQFDSEWERRRMKRCTFDLLDRMTDKNRNLLEPVIDFYFEVFEKDVNMFEVFNLRRGLLRTESESRLRLILSEVKKRLRDEGLDERKKSHLLKLRETLAERGI